MIQSVARSRDDNLLSDIESTLRAAVQQSDLTGSSEPLVAVLKQADDRLARASQPRLEPVRRAIAHDLDRARTTSQADVSVLSIRIEEVVRMVDELPLLSASEPRRDLANGDADAPPARPGPAASAAGAMVPADGIGTWISRQLATAGRFVADNVWTRSARWSGSRGSTSPMRCWSRPSRRSSCART